MPNNRPQQSSGPLRIGVLWRGNPAEPALSGEATRLRAIFRALTAQGAVAVPVIFADGVADQARDQLLALDGVLVWVDPIMDGVNRVILDGVLRDVASHGIYVSAHPDVVLRMGTKDVLYQTREMSWGTDVRRYASPGDLLHQLPAALDRGPRVLKQHRGNGGNGVWRVEWVTNGAGGTRAEVYLLHGLRGSAVETVTLGELVRRLEPYFAGVPCMIDQAFQARLADGMIRCYLAQDRVAGFGHQMVTALLAAREAGAETPPPPPRVYYGPGHAEFQVVRERMESEWLPDLLRTLDLETAQLPAIWDVDLLYGERTVAAPDSYVLCEINVSSVFPIPDESVEPLARVAVRNAAAAKAARAH